FIPVFTMEAAEGKLFGPLAYTKTFALIAALIVSLLILPMLAHVFFGFKIKNQRYKLLGNGLLLILGVGALIYGYTWAGIMLLLFGIISFAKLYVEKEAIEIPKRIRPIYNQLEIILAIGGVVWLL